MDDSLSLVAAASAGVALAAVAGLRAFLPLFVVGAAARAGWLALGGSFAWLGSTPALLAFGSAVVLELLADKVPAVDHALDSVGLLVRPAAGVVAVAAVTSELDPLWSAVLAVLVGGSVSGAVTVAKAKARVGSSVLSLGLANPLVSLAEDVASFALALLSVLWPLVALGSVVALALALWGGWRLARLVLGRPQPA